MSSTAFTKADDGSSLHSLTCITCRLLFSTSKDQRLHYQTDFHRFNLKRKVAELPPVSEEAFLDKVKNSENDKESPQTIKKAPETSEVSYKCKPCKKYFASPNTLETHFKSKKHVQKAVHYDEADEKEEKDVSNAGGKSSNEDEMDTTETAGATSKQPEFTPEQIAAMTDEEYMDMMIKKARPMEKEECLFCLFKSDSLEANMKHMAVVHSLFIPDIEYLVDLEGLVKYLGEMISVGNMCVYCGDKKYFPSLETAQSHMREAGHCKIPYEDHLEEFEDFFDFSKDYEGNATPTDQNMQIQVRHNQTPVVVSETGYSINLAGKSIGHRSLLIYYKQKYRQKENRESVLSTIREYKMLGWIGSEQHTIEKNKRMPIYMKQHNQKLALKVGIANNNQKHYLDMTKML